MQASHAATDGIPFGQPILGHHSEGRHRRALARSDNAMRRSIEHDKKADYYRNKAAGVGKAGISSDDPEAVTKLLAKIANAEKSQQAMKAANKIIRNKKLTDDEKMEQLVEFKITTRKILEPDFCGRIGFPDYELKNNNANIRRMKQRVEQLRQAPTETTTEKIGAVEIVNKADLNRTQVFFPDKPSAEIRQLLKSHGFRWSRYEGAWQRHISTQAQYWAGIVAAQYEGA